MSAYRDALLALSPVIVGFPRNNPGDVIAVPQFAGSGTSGSTSTSYGGAAPFKHASRVLPDDPAYAIHRGCVRHGNVSGLTDLVDGFSVVSIVYAVSRSSAWDRIISFGTAFIDSEVIFSRDGVNDEFHLGFWNGVTHTAGLALATTGGKFPLNTFIHVAGVYDRGAAQIRLYVNGVLSATGTPAAAMRAAPGRSNVGFSGTTTGSNEEYMSGLNILPAIFGKVLTGAEIADLASKAAMRTISGTAKLSDTLTGATRVIGVTTGGASAFSAKPDPATGEWSALCTPEQVNILYAGPAGYLPQTHGPY